MLVLGRSLSEFMRALGLEPVGGVRTRLRNQMRRLFSASISLAYESGNDEVSIRSPITDHSEFWWNEHRPDERSLWQSKVELGEKLFQEIIRHPVPLNMNTLKALKRSSLGLDLYLWVVRYLRYRTFSLKRPLRLSWRQIYRQFGVDPAQANDKVTVQAFRRKVLRELKKIKMAWPDLNYSTAKGTLVLSPSKSAVPPGQQLQLVS